MNTKMALQKLTIDEVYSASDQRKNRKASPLFMQKVSAGFPSPADDFIENPLDLNELLIQNPSSTFFVRVQGNSMINAGIKPGDILIVDRSKEPLHRSIVIAVLNGEFTVKRLHKRGKKISLMPANKRFMPIQINEFMDFEVWGVVTHIIHSTR